MKKVRKSNIELLRIIAILLIISFHYVYKSEYIYSFDSLSFNEYIFKTFYFFGELGVNLFALITGYFLIKNKFSLKKLIKLILEVDFYYLLLIPVSIIFKIDTGLTFISIKDYFLMFFPIILNKYWFITAYLLVYCLSPFLNILINKMSQIEYKRLIIVVVLIWSIIPTFFGLFFNDTETLLYYNRFIWLIIMYIIGGYNRLYSIKFFNNKKNIYLTALISFVIMLLSILVIYRFRYKFLILGTKELAYLWPP